MFHYVHILYRQRMARSWTLIIVIQMIVVVIVIGMLVGYGIGQYLVDEWINNNNKDINKDL
jgi:uncharacterized protein YneF (UPF0154 family)